MIDGGAINFVFVLWSAAFAVVGSLAIVTVVAAHNRKQPVRVRRSQ